eukprot:TRINITY_DN11018_c0_g1_i1.p1 TRINITY_DN11018_c0_g1~~TRINITY_DN11018_c0_g1_i1.p1  ORF type:complete len:308 (+),score=86.36 TRINITY_DN11018_c0_g1_i1:352-1275(+)
MFRLALPLCSRGTACLLLSLALVAISATLTTLQYLTLGPSRLVNNVFLHNFTQVYADLSTIFGFTLISGIAQAGQACLGVFVALLLQRAVVMELHARYFSRKVLYTINATEKWLDNVDQRMVQDVTGMTDSLAWLIGSPYAYQGYKMGFVGHLLQLCIKLPVALYLSWSLTVVLLGYGLLCGAVQTLLGGLVADVTADRQKAEGELRSHLTRVRTFCESIAFYGGQQAELVTANRLLDDLYDARMRFARRASVSLFSLLLSSCSSFGMPYLLAAVVLFVLPSAASTSHRPIRSYCSSASCPSSSSHW